MTSRLRTSSRWAASVVAASLVIVALLASPVLASTGTIDTNTGAPGDPITISGTCSSGYRQSVGWAWLQNLSGPQLVYEPALTQAVDQGTGAFTLHVPVPDLPPASYFVFVACVGPSGQDLLFNGSFTEFFVVAPSPTVPPTEPTPTPTSTPDTAPVSTAPVSPPQVQPTFTG